MQSRLTANHRKGRGFRNRSKDRMIIIACATIIEEMRPILPPDTEYLSLEFQLHLHPDNLRAKLQEVVDETTPHADRIVLGYGLCSMAVIGLKAAKSTLVIPRVDDCIGLFLGSQSAYRKQLRKEPGTYFLSRGWIESGATLIEEFKGVEARYGKRRAEMVKRRMLEHYTRLAFIDMGYRDQKRYRAISRRAANELDLRYEEIKGTSELLRKTFTGPWDHGFVVAPPGHVIALEDFGMIPDEGPRSANRGV